MAYFNEFISLHIFQNTVTECLKKIIYNYDVESLNALCWKGCLKVI